MFIDISLTILSYYLVTVLCGLVAFVFITKMFSGQTLATYVFSKVVGPVIVAYLVYVLASLGILPISSLSVWLILVGALVLTFVFVSRGFSINSNEFYAILKLELILLVLFSIFTLYRMFGNYYFGSESYMNFGIYLSAHRGGYLPPNDMWLSGESLNYYYFGHFMGVIFSKLAFLSPEVSYTLNLSWLFIMTVALVYTIPVALSKKWLAGVLAVLLTFSGNLYFVYAFLVNPNVSLSALVNETRLFGQIPMEHPAYSFFLTDQHANVFSLPITLGIFLLLVLFSQVTQKLTLSYYALLGFLLGILFMTNGWDFYIMLFVTLVYFVYTFWHTRRFPLYGLILLFVVSQLTTYIYKLTFTVPLTTFKFDFNLNLLAVSIQFGVFFLLIFLYLAIMYAKSDVKLVSFLSSMQKTVPVLVVFFFVIALALVFIPSLVYPIGDHKLIASPAVGNFNINGFNGYLKFWYIAWILFSICVGCVFYSHIEALFQKSCSYRAYKLLGLVIFSMFIFVYPSYLVCARIIGARYQSMPFSLDGTLYLKDISPDRYYAIRYLNSLNLGRSNVLLEAPGEPYIEFNSIFSSYTGIPTVIGWGNHEIIWNNNADTVTNRVNDVALIYSGRSPVKILSLLRKYHVSHLIISDREKNLYGDSAGTIASFFGTKVFVSDTVEIFEFNGSISSITQ